MADEFSNIPLEDLTTPGNDPVQDTIFRLMQGNVNRARAAAQTPEERLAELPRELEEDPTLGLRRLSRMPGAQSPDELIRQLLLAQEPPGLQRVRRPTE